MDITSLQPDEDTQRILGHILAELEPDDPERPWKKGELQCPVQEDDFPVPELARAALVWAGFASQSGWDGAPRQDGSSSRSNADVAATIATGVRDELALCPEYCSGLRAVLVKVDGRTVFEKYYNASPDDTFNTCSVTKSVLSTLVGIAVGEGKLDLHETLSQLLPKYASSMAPPTSGATLRQLLSRTAGFNDRSEFEFSADWVEDIVTSADVTPPGDRFVYSNESAHLVSAILAEATGESVLQYARARLFDPLEISTEPAFTPAFTPPFDAGDVADYLGAGFAWPVDPQGHATGHCWLKLRPDDLAKIGQLYLDRGTYGGREVMSSDWVREATTNQSEAPVSDFGGDGYGFLWWVRSADDDPAYAALGSGGQMIEVIPTLRLVVVTAVEVDDGDATDHGIDLSWPLSLTESVIAPAVRGES